MNLDAHMNREEDHRQRHEWLWETVRWLFRDLRSANRNVLALSVFMDDVTAAREHWIDVREALIELTLDYKAVTGESASSISLADFEHWCEKQAARPDHVLYVGRN